MGGHTNDAVAVVSVSGADDGEIDGVGDGGVDADRDDSNAIVSTRDAADNSEDGCVGEHTNDAVVVVSVSGADDGEYDGAGDGGADADRDDSNASVSTCECS